MIYQSWHINFFALTDFAARARCIWFWSWDYFLMNAVTDVNFDDSSFPHTEALSLLIELAHSSVSSFWVEIQLGLLLCLILICTLNWMIWRRRTVKTEGWHTCCKPNLMLHVWLNTLSTSCYLSLGPSPSLPSLWSTWKKFWTGGW